MIYYIIIPLLEAIVIIRFASVFIISMVLILKSNQYSLSVDIFSQIYFSIHSVCNTYCTMYNVQCTMYHHIRVQVVNYKYRYVICYSLDILSICN